ncbi:MAG: DUF1569 domain-containing protein [Phycisphaerales bacterium]|nr:DUF1569 domain-containing protein [Phycisphaerales bacterium]
MINTGETTDRRELRFASVDELRAEIDRIVAADNAGTLRCAGNWSAGQVFNHLAAWINYAYEGYPIKLPWLIRLMVRLKRSQVIHNAMTPGIWMPGLSAGTTATEPVPTDEAAESLRRALVRLQSDEAAPYKHAAFGKLSHADRIALNLRHAELHMSFLHP